MVLPRFSWLACNKHCDTACRHSAGASTATLSWHDLLHAAFLVLGTTPEASRLTLHMPIAERACVRDYRLKSEGRGLGKTATVVDEAWGSRGNDQSQPRVDQSAY